MCRLRPRKARPSTHLEANLLSPRRGNVGLTPPRPGGHMQIRKSDFAWRALAFVVLEIGFLMLAGYCLINPIPFRPPSIISLGEAKAMITAAAVVWHTVAAFLIKDIISSVFSAECAAQYHRTGQLKPDSTDQVSRITSGLLVQVSYFLTKRPTLEYRIAFILALLVIALSPLGSGIIALTESTRVGPLDLQLANLSMTKSIGSSAQRLCSKRASTFVQLELVEKGMYGYETSDNLLIPWPEPGSKSAGGISNLVTYESDVVAYDYSCHWPEFSMSVHAQDLQIAPEVVIPGLSPNDTKWTLWGEGARDLLMGVSPIRPLIMERDVLYSYDDQNAHTSLNPFIFADLPDAVDFTGIDTSIQFPLGDFLTDPGPSPIRMVAVLLCDPTYTIRRATVLLSNNQLNATILPESPLIGNLPESAANALFSQALIEALKPLDPAEIGPSPASKLVFAEPSDTIAPFLFIPSKLTRINENMNRAIKSAAKAYLSGYSASGVPLISKYSSINRTATIQYQETALATNRPFLISLVALDTAITMVLIALLGVVDVGAMRLFSLRTLEEIYTGMPFLVKNFGFARIDPQSAYHL